MQLPDNAVTVVDLPQLAETFADSVGAITFDGQVLRIEFCVTRLDPVTPDKPPSGKRYPSCRLVLTNEAATTLSHQLQELMAQIQRQALLGALPTEGVPKH